MTFTGTQLNYSTLERELTALRWGIKTFRPFLYGVAFILYTDHQPLVHLHNMKIVCSRLARTVEELSDFIFEIRYVPGHLNSAADALSRLSCQIPTCYEPVVESALPAGLVLNGPVAPGGGDSLFVSLHRSLSELTDHREVPGTEHELRTLLVDDLINHAAKYNLQLDRDSRKQLRLMRCPGQLPSLDILLAASRLFKVRIFVYFWKTEPVVYQSEDYPTVIHLQCISGVHFNPLIEVKNYVPPDLQQCSINSVHHNHNVPYTSNYKELDSDDDELPDETEDPLLTIDEDCKYCSHTVSSLASVSVSVNKHRLCAVFDTCAEISLVSISGLKLIQESIDVDIHDEHVCDIIGFSGVKTPITITVELSFKIGSYIMPKKFKFAVVQDTELPYCFLLSL
jgi:hypothetical protein